MKNILQGVAIFALAVACGFVAAQVVLAILLSAATASGAERPSFYTGDPKPPQAAIDAEEIQGTLDAQEAEIKLLRFEIERLRTAKVPSSSSAPAVAAGTSPSLLKSANEDKAAVDDRMVVYVYSHFADPRQCPPCVAQLADEKLLPYRFDHSRPPPAGEQFELSPTLHWTKADGSGGIYKGWTTAADFMKAVESTRSVTAVASASSPADTIAMIARFAGTSGKFTFTPSTSIKASLDDSTTVSYTAISGTYTVRNGVAAIVIDQPQPMIDAHKFFAHFGTRLLGAEYPVNGGNAVSVSTGIKKFVIKLEEAK